MSNRDNDPKKIESLLKKQKEAKIVRRIVLWISLAIFLILAGSITGGFLYVKSALNPLDPDDNQKRKVEIPIGSSSSDIGKILENKGIIKDATIFKYYIKFKNESGFQAGMYELSPSMELDEIIEIMKTGKVVNEVAIKITIPEGQKIEEIVKTIAKETGYSEDEVMATINDESFLQELMNQYPALLTEDILGENVKIPLEGYLFPATYSFESEKPPLKEIITTMVNQTQIVLNKYLPIMKERKLSVHELLTFASLVEEEATEKADRNKIASVFYNRLATGMPLQTDPTVLYALGVHKELVTYKDTEVVDPYNTYIHTGLPPGPIANSGVISIEAVLYPEETDYFYFLATKDGEVLFSKTLEEHNEKKRKYLLN